MNSTSLLFLMRRDPIVGLCAHLAAGIVALFLLTGAARTRPAPAATPATVASVVAPR